MLDHKIDSLPVDILKIAKAANVRVIKNSTVHILNTGECGRSYSDGTNWYIVYNDSEPTEISRFTIAHELGHCFLRHELKYIQYSHMRGVAPKPISEQQANKFAIRLLCPACVLWALELRTPEEISRYCKVDINIATERSKRMKTLYKRNKFLKDPLEQEVYKSFHQYISSNLENSLEK